MVAVAGAMAVEMLMTIAVAAAEVLMVASAGINCDLFPKVHMKSKKVKLNLIGLILPMPVFGPYGS